MKFKEIMIIVAGLLQFLVASYALRFKKLFASARVRWSLFWAFMLLPLLLHGGWSTDRGASDAKMEVNS